MTLDNCFESTIIEVPFLLPVIEYDYQEHDEKRRVASPQLEEIKGRVQLLFVDKASNHIL